MKTIGLSPGKPCFILLKISSSRPLRMTGAISRSKAGPQQGRSFTIHYSPKSSQRCPNTLKRPKRWSIGAKITISSPPIPNSKRSDKHITSTQPAGQTATKLASIVKDRPPQTTCSLQLMRTLKLIFVFIVGFGFWIFHP